MKDDSGATLVLGLIGLGLLLLWANSRQGAGAVQSYSAQPASIKPSKSYDNEEIREITYNDDGLPTRIVIHRHAIAA